MDNVLHSIKGGKILVADDSPTNLLLLVEILRSKYEVIKATNGFDTIEIAKSEQPDLILLDIKMPDIDGYEVCKALKADPETTTIPIIFITGLIDAAAETQGLLVGAADYITKPINRSIVQMRVDNHIKLTKALTVLERLSTIDELTNVANRRSLDIRLTTEVKRLKRHKLNLSFILLDVDYFKSFNDTYGHIKGDECLTRISHAIQEAVQRPQDFIGRYGGEEFCCIAPETSHEGAMHLAESIRQQIQNLKILHAASNINDFITASFGVITVTNGNGITITPTEIIEHTDKLLYQAKEQGRNCVVGSDMSFSSKDQ